MRHISANKHWTRFIELHLEVNITLNLNMDTNFGGALLQMESFPHKPL
jgi:hypothetical protein